MSFSLIMTFLENILCLYVVWLTVRRLHVTPPSYKMGSCVYSRLNGVMIILQFLPRTISFTFISELSNFYIFYKLSILEYGVCVFAVLYAGIFLYCHSNVS